MDRAQAGSAVRPIWGTTLCRRCGSTTWGTTLRPIRASSTADPPSRFPSIRVDGGSGRDRGDTVRARAPVPTHTHQDQSQSTSAVVFHRRRWELLSANSSPTSPTPPFVRRSSRQFGVGTSKRPRLSRTQFSSSARRRDFPNGIHRAHVSPSEGAASQVPLRRASRRNPRFIQSHLSRLPVLSRFSDFHHCEPLLDLPTYHLQ